mmetsp:Transcript_5439/g.8430  ORF Transcript_5439/g.8430 Transcript_5439/m.8430 type:complete len:98 (+) Transcript_5439:398-691(+)
MQNDNSEIETETISRLQLIEKFGNDAQSGLTLARQQNQKINQDLQEQKTQHAEVMKEQFGQRQHLSDNLDRLEKSLKQLRGELDQKQNSHKKAMLTQ